MGPAWHRELIIGSKVCSLLNQLFLVQPKVAVNKSYYHLMNALQSKSSFKKQVCISQKPSWQLTPIGTFVGILSRETNKWMGCGDWTTFSSYGLRHTDSAVVACALHALWISVSWPVNPSTSQKHYIKREKNKSAALLVLAPKFQYSNEVTLRT